MWSGLENQIVSVSTMNDSDWYKKIAEARCNVHPMGRPVGDAPVADCRRAVKIRLLAH